MGYIAIIKMLVKAGSSMATMFEMYKYAVKFKLVEKAKSLYAKLVSKFKKAEVAEPVIEIKPVDVTPVVEALVEEVKEVVAKVSKKKTK